MSLQLAFASTMRSWELTFLCDSATVAFWKDDALCILWRFSVRGNAVFGRYYAVFQARTPFWKLRRVPWTQFYCGQYSRFEARFSHFQCCNPFCVYERFINSNLIADAQFQTPCAAVWHARCRHCHHTTGCNAHRLWCDSDSGATKRVIHNIFIYMH